MQTLAKAHGLTDAQAECVHELVRRVQARSTRRHTHTRNTVHTRNTRAEAACSGKDGSAALARVAVRCRALAWWHAGMLVLGISLYEIVRPCSAMASTSALAGVQPSQMRAAPIGSAVRTA